MQATAWRDFAGTFQVNGKYQISNVKLSEFQNEKVLVIGIGALIERNPEGFNPSFSGRMPLIK